MQSATLFANAGGLATFSADHTHPDQVNPEIDIIDASATATINPSDIPTTTAIDLNALIGNPEANPVVIETEATPHYHGSTISISADTIIVTTGGNQVAVT
jgi:hypothetical protein